MEAIIGRAKGGNIETAASEWVRATSKLVRVTLRAAGHFLVHYSRASILLRGGERTFRRI